MKRLKQYFVPSSGLMVLISLVLLTPPKVVQAQPSDEQVTKDLMNPGVISIKLTKKPGTKQWNSDVGAWEFVRGAEIKREYPDIDGVDLVVVGDAVYQLYGTQYKWWKFRVISNEYLGIPNPTEDEIKAMINQDLEKFVTNYWYNRIVGDIKDIRLADEPKWFWHVPTSVSFQMTAIYDAITSDIHIESVEQDFEVRLYRDNYKEPWKNFISSSSERRPLEKRTYRADEVRAMQTLGSIDSERKAQAELAALPQVNIPTFERGIDFIIHTHNMLRESTPEQLESYLMKVLAPHFFIEGSSVKLTQRGADLINQSVEQAFQKKGTYKQQYCKDPGIDRKRSSEKRFYILGCINNVNTMIAVDVYGGTYKEGVKVGQEWKISDMRVGTRQDQDAIDFINSFTDRSKLCPND